MTYQIQYAVAWVNAASGVVAGALSAAYLAAHPSWLTSDIALTCGIVVTITVAFSQILPPLTRTPAQREAKYIAALAGSLPDDIAQKHGLIVTPEPGGLKVETPEIPPPH